MSKKFNIKLTRRNSNEMLPYFVEDVFPGATPQKAHELAKLRYPGYEAEWYDIVEVDEAPAVAKKGTRSTSSGTGGAMFYLVGLVVVGLLIWKSGEIRQYVAEMKQASGPEVEQVGGGMADPTDQAADPNASDGEPRSQSLVGMDLTPRPAQVNQDGSGVASASAPAAGQLPATAATMTQARIVDSRKQIVLQAGPKMSAKNVAKIDTGSVVQVIEPGEKWVQVQTDDGLVGYVRATQLESL